MGIIQKSCGVIVMLMQFVFYSGLQAGIKERVDYSKSPQRYWGLIIALDDQYNKMSQWSSVENGRGIVKILKEQYGFTEQRVIELYNENATGAMIESAFMRLRKETVSGDALFIYIALPIKQDNGESFLVTADARSDGVTQTKFQKLISCISNPLSLIIIEGCYNISYAQNEPYQQRIKGTAFNMQCPIISMCPTFGRIEKNPGEVLQRALQGGVPTRSGVITQSSLFQYLQKNIDVYKNWDIVYDGSQNEFILLPSSVELYPNLTRPILDTKNTVQDRNNAIMELVNSVRISPDESKSELYLKAGELLWNLAANDAEPVAVRSQAVLGLGDLQYNTCVEEMAKLLHAFEPDLLKESVVEALGKMHTDQSMSILRNTLTDNDPVIRIRGIKTLSQLRDEPSLQGILELMQTDPNIKVRLTALQSVAVHLLPQQQMVQRLEAMINDPEPAMRNEVVNAFARLGNKDITPILLQRFSLEKDVQVQQNLVYKMGSLCNEKSRTKVQETLIQVLKDDYAQNVREAAVFSLGQIADKDADKPLRKTLSDKNAQVRRAAIEALGNLKSRKAVDELIDLTEDKDPSIRRAAAVALGKIGDEKAAETLLRILNDPDLYVRSAAQNSLNQIKIGSKYESLLKALKSSSADIRMEAVRKLAYSAEANLVPELMPLLADDDYAVRQTAIAGIKRFKDEESFQIVAQSLDNELFLIRQGCAAILSDSDRPQAADILIQHSQDPHAAVRAEVIRSLSCFQDERIAEPMLAAFAENDDMVRRTAGESLVKYYVLAEMQDKKQVIKNLQNRIRDIVTARDRSPHPWQNWFTLFFIKRPSPDLEVIVNPDDPKHTDDASHTMRQIMNGEKVTIKVVNRGEAAIFIYIIDLSGDGSMIDIFPYYGISSTSVEPGSFVTVEVFADLEARGEMIDLIKVFAVTHPWDMPETGAMERRDVLLRSVTEEVGIITAEKWIKTVRK